MHKKTNTLIAFLIFLIAEVTCLLTMAPTASFWDCGEFITSAFTMGVTHPPGSPISMMLGRIFTLIPIFSNIGMRVNLVSTLFSAFSIMLLYLIVVRFIILYRGKNPDEMTLSERISMYASGIIGALALGWSDSFWFNSVETSVWAASQFFTHIVVWLMLKWYEVADEEGNEKWLMLVLYMMGLSLGVHLLNLLTIFGLSVMYYFRRYEFSIKGFAALMVISVLLFFTIYPGIVKVLPDLMNNTTPWIGLVIVLALVYAIYYTQQNKMRLANTFAVSLFLIILGYASYGATVFRAQAHPPLNESDPSNMARFHSYLNREQYGDFPLLKRRWSQDPDHQQYYAKYSSDLDYFFTYQVSHMYYRYLGWQFIGRAGDDQDAPVDWSKYWGIPLLLGLCGAIFHFKKDWKMALSVSALFTLTGIAIIFYLNQTEPQPRERDYSYVGSFFAFAIWIGIGVDAIIDYVKDLLKTKTEAIKAGASIGVAALLLVFVNGRMLQVNYHTHSRAGNYTPWDYAYNLLQSCEKDAILFTNGDNDTFPLWYLQEVEGVRTDVRVANLSLLNTDWYMLQLKNEMPRGAKKAPISFTNERISNLTYEPWAERTIKLPVPKQKLIDRGEFSSTDPLIDTLVWTIKPPISDGSGHGYMMAKDLMIYDMIVTNKWERPIYFAITCSPSNFLGLDNYLRMDALAYKVVPIKSAGSYDNVNRDIMYRSIMEPLEGEKYFKEPHYGFKYRNLNNPNVYYDENARRMVSNYKNIFYRLAQEYAGDLNGYTVIKHQDGKDETVSNKQMVVRVLDKAEEILPTEKYGSDYRLMERLVALYMACNAPEKANKLIPQIEEQARSEMQANPQDPTPLVILQRAYQSVGDLKKAITVTEQLEVMYPGDQSLKQNLDALKRMAGETPRVADTAAKK
jgi:hypothetical protein